MRLADGVRRTMHRDFEITVAAGVTDGLSRELDQLDDVVSLSAYRGASVEPLGDVIYGQVLNRLS